MKPVIRSFWAAIAACSIRLISYSKDDIVTGAQKLTVN